MIRHSSGIFSSGKRKQLGKINSGVNDAEKGQEGNKEMKKRLIDVNEYAGDIVKALRGGVLLTTKAGTKVNSMVIGWGTLGVNWSLPVFAVYVREGRFTREQLDRNPEFTINIPLGTPDRNVIAVCGGMSGRDIDKVKDAGLTLTDPLAVTVPGIREFPLTLECKVIYRQKQELAVLDPEICRKHYPQDVDSSASGSNRDAHVTYFGEILSAYILED